MWTFAGGRTISIKRSYITFVAVCCTGLLARLGVMHLLIVFADLDKGYRYVVNNFIGIAIATAVNFLGSKYLAFAGKRLALNKLQ
jgi:putative flippase GtrA